MKHAQRRGNTKCAFELLINACQTSFAAVLEVKEQIVLQQPTYASLSELRTNLSLRMLLLLLLHDTEKWRRATRIEYRLKLQVHRELHYVEMHCRSPKLVASLPICSSASCFIQLHVIVRTDVLWKHCESNVQRFCQLRFIVCDKSRARMDIFKVPYSNSKSTPY